MTIRVGVPISRITAVLILTVLLLVAASFVTSIIVVLKDIETGYFLGFRNSLSVGREANIPTWFSSTMLIFAGLFLLLVGYHKRQMGQAYFSYWLVLGFMLMALSLDESTELHEASIKPVRELLHTGGLLYWAWIIPGAIAVVIVGLLCLPFLFHLPPGIQRIFLVAAALYVAGAIGMEAVSGQFYDAAGFADDTLVRGHQDAMIYTSLVHIEEMLEMLGVVVLIHGLLTYARLIELPLFTFGSGD